MTPEFFAFAVASAAAFLALAVLGVAWRSLHRAQQLEHRYRLYAHRDELIRLGAQGVIDPNAEAFVDTLYGVNVWLHLNDQLGVDFYKFEEELGSDKRHAAVLEQTLAYLADDQRIALQRIRKLIGKTTLTLMCHNSRVVRLVVWARKQQAQSANNHGSGHRSLMTKRRSIFTAAWGPFSYKRPELWLPGVPSKDLEQELLSNGLSVAEMNRPVSAAGRPADEPPGILAHEAHPELETDRSRPSPGSPFGDG